MSTRRDYKPRTAKRRKKKPISGWMWLGTGLAVGLFVALLMLLAGKREQLQAERQALPVEPPAAAAVAPEPEPAPTKPQPVKPRYDFYAILPEKEVEIPEEELRSEDAARAAAYQGPWMLQAGSFRSFPDADRLKASLAFQGLESSIDVSENDSGTWHRVRLGPFQSRREADRIKSRLARQNVNSIILRLRP